MMLQHGFCVYILQPPLLYRIYFAAPALPGMNVTATLTGLGIGALAVAPAGVVADG
jgi:hypothetical protein